jgi:lactoylglutathione lyase
MRLAKPQMDVGLSTNRIEPLLRFWQDEAGVAFDHVLRIRRGQDQHRHDIGGSVLKLNAHAEPLPNAPPSGYRELLIAREGLRERRRMADPDGNLVSLVGVGEDGVTQIAVRLAVRDLDAHRRFYGETLGLPEARPGAFQAGESLIILEPSVSAPADAQIRGTGWRYITFQVFEVDSEYAAALERGAHGAVEPVTLGTTARIAMIRDPDGNWIELSQRASIVGSLAPALPR